MHRLRVKVFSVLALVVVLPAAGALPARAAASSATASASFWYAGTRLNFERPQLRAGALAVGSDDSGLGRFLTKLGATLEYQPGQNYVIVTAGDRKTVTLTLGDTRYSVDGIMQTAPFAPYVSGGVVFLPFLELARALHVVPVEDGTMTVLQPQLAALDVRTESRVTVLTFHGASPLRFKRISDAADENLSLAFSGIGSTLDRDRTVAGAGLKNVSIAPGGNPKNPTTVVTFTAAPGSAHVLIPTDSGNTLSVAFAPPGVALGGTPVPADGTPGVATVPLVIRDARAPGATRVAPPPPVATAPTPTAAGLPVAEITNFSTDDMADGLRVHLKIAGDVTYEWHRLPDSRWYVDLKPATLAIPTQETPLQNSAVQSLRMKSFVGPTDRLQTVRLAFTLATPRLVTIVPEPGGLTVAVDALDDASGQRVGVGEISNGKIVASIITPPTPAPAPPAEPLGGGWKFSPAPGASGNGRLIVIDPGHGGSDAGAMQNGLVEKDLNLDLSKRLRTVLVARGWQVKLTRETDVDVYAPNDSAHDELQARDDIANNAGARFFISMHTNSYTASYLNGTTTYYYTAQSYPFAQAVHARLAATLPTKDDGIRKENFYVIHHTAIPSILIETAFMSNPTDAAYLRSPAFMAKLATAIADGVGDFAASPSSVSATKTSDDR
ncbi:MAG: hypothetical protein NVSMB19_00430 [Vulcanimicrobiaceae bacterium]